MSDLTLTGADRAEPDRLVAAPAFVAVARAAPPARVAEVRRLRGADRPIVIDPVR